jgi:hypothetical protein
MMAVTVTGVLDKLAIAAPVEKPAALSQGNAILE